jgi:hypothetical protein
MAQAGRALIDGVGKGQMRLAVQRPGRYEIRLCLDQPEGGIVAGDRASPWVVPRRSVAARTGRSMAGGGV